MRFFFGDTMIQRNDKKVRAFFFFYLVFVFNIGRNRIIPKLDKKYYVINIYNP